MSEIIDKISNAIEKLGRLTRVEVQENWTICDEECRLANLRRDEWENASRNEKGHIIWPKGREVLWFSQSIVVPEHLYNYPLTGLSLRLCLTWWAEDALIYVRDRVAHQGDLFDSSVRLLLSSSVQPGDQFWVSLRLVSPQHDIGALMHSSLIYEITEDKEEGRQDKEEGRRKKEEGRGKTVGVVPECLPQSPVPSPLSWGDPGFVADELALIKIFLSENSLLSPTENQETRGISLEDSKKSDESPQNSLTDISLSPSGDPETACREKKTVSTALVKETLRDRVVSCALDQINWDALPDRQEFTRSLIDFHKSLLPYINKDNLGKIYLIGHSHLDLAWLWEIHETWEVAKNTFTSVLNLQKDFPELLFCHTTPALYAWLEENQPDLFNSIKQQIDTGRWEVIGGLWVEPELNLISGESIARQILYGQRYSLEKFGKPMEIAWLPDTFGFCWQLPQLLKEGGIKFFVTQKLRWNDTTKFPHDIFWWESPDGSRILSLMSAPIGEGINPIKMTNYLGEWQRKTGLANALWLPGVGDHGGGPTRDMLEIAYRWEKSPFCPKFEFKKVGDYLHELSNLIYSLNLDSRDNETRAEREKSIYKERDDSTSLSSDVLSLGCETSIYKERDDSISLTSDVLSFRGEKSIYKERDDSTSSTSDVLSLGWETPIYKERDDSISLTSDSLSLSRDMSIYEKHDSTSLTLSTDTSIDKGEKDLTSLGSDFLSSQPPKDSITQVSDFLSLREDTSIYKERDDSTCSTSDVLSLPTKKDSTSLASDVLFSQGDTSIDNGEKDSTSLGSDFLSLSREKDSTSPASDFLFSQGDTSIDNGEKDSTSLGSDFLSSQPPKDSITQVSDFLSLREDTSDIYKERDDSTCSTSNVLSLPTKKDSTSLASDVLFSQEDTSIDKSEKDSTSLGSDFLSLSREKDSTSPASDFLSLPRDTSIYEERDDLTSLASDVLSLSTEKDSTSFASDVLSLSTEKDSTSFASDVFFSQGDKSIDKGEKDSTSLASDFLSLPRETSSIDKERDDSTSFASDSLSLPWQKDSTSLGSDFLSSQPPKDLITQVGDFLSLRRDTSIDKERDDSTSFASDSLSLPWQKDSTSLASDFLSLPRETSSIDKERDDSTSFASDSSSLPREKDSTTLVSDVLFSQGDTSIYKYEKDSTSLASDFLSLPTEKDSTSQVNDVLFSQGDTSIYKYEERDDSISLTSDSLSLGCETSIYKYEERDDSTFWASDSLSLSRDMSIYEKHDSTSLTSDFLSLPTEKDSTSLARDVLFSQRDTSINNDEKDSTCLASDFLSFPRETSSIDKERDDSTCLRSDSLSLPREKDSTSLASDVLFSQGDTSINKGEKDSTPLVSDVLSSQPPKDLITPVSDFLSLPRDTSIYKERDDSTFRASDSLSLSRDMSIYEKHDSTCLRSDSLSLPTEKDSTSLASDVLFSQGDTSIDNDEKDSTCLASDFLSSQLEKDSTSLAHDFLSLPREKDSTSLASDVLSPQRETSIDKGEKDSTSLASDFLSILRETSSIYQERDDSISLTGDTLSLQSEISIDEERDDSTSLRSDVLSTRGISIHKTSVKNHVKGRWDSYPTVISGEVYPRETNSTSLRSDTLSLGGETFLSDSELDSLTDTTIKENDETRSRFFAHPTLTDNQDKENLPVWRDELYLEFHRGCYTTHAEQKYWNRYSEGLLYEAELFSTFASIFADFPYPKTALEIAWKQTLFNQFHDILPGTSIPEVYEEVNPTWQQVTEKGEEILKNAIASLASHLLLPTPPHLHAKPIIVFNSLNWIRSEVVSIPLPTSQDNFRVYNVLGEETPTQLSCLHDNTHLLFLAPYIPSLGYRVFWLTPENPPQTEKCTENDNFIFSVAQENALCQENNFAGQEWVLENTALRVTIDEKTGNLTSLYDKANHRETLNENGGNLLQAFTDSGQYWDAWNIDPNYQDYPLPAPTLISIQWIENGEIRQRIRVIRKIANSDFCQDYILDVASPLLRIETKVNWQETHVFVKAAFNFNLNVDFVNYEIASGAIARTTQPKTAQEKAKWEVSALRWADMSNHEYGVSLLNNCKYGYDATPNQLRLSLLRGSTWPDPNADQGFHHFSYAVYPHQGNWQDSKTVHQGYAFNLPLKVWLSSPQLPCFYGNPIDEPENQEKGEGKFLDLGDESLVLMALKQAEEQDNVWILRCYESEGKHSNLSLTPEGQWQILAEVDLLEKARSCFNLRITPWQIKTFAVTSNAL